MRFLNIYSLLFFHKIYCVIVIYTLKYLLGFFKGNKEEDLFKEND
jgi:hypothetical protein